MKYCKIEEVPDFLKGFPKMGIEELIEWYKKVYENPATIKLKEMVEKKIVKILSCSFPAMRNNKNSLKKLIGWMEEIGGGCHGTSAVIQKALNLIEKRTATILIDKMVLREITLEEILEFYRTCYCRSADYTTTRIIQDEIIRCTKGSSFSDICLIEMKIFNCDTKMLSFLTKAKKEIAEKKLKSTDSLDELIKMRNKFSRNTADKDENEAIDDIEKKILLKIAEIPPTIGNMEKFNRLNSFISDRTMSVSLNKLIDKKVSATVELLDPTIENMELLVSCRNKFKEFGQYDFIREMARILKVIISTSTNSDELPIRRWLNASIFRTYMPSCIGTPARHRIETSDATSLLKKLVLEKIENTTNLLNLFQLINEFDEFFVLNNFACIVSQIKEKIIKLIRLSGKIEKKSFLEQLKKKYEYTDHFEILSVSEEEFVNSLIEA